MRCRVRASAPTCINIRRIGRSHRQSRRDKKKTGTTGCPGERQETKPVGSPPHPVHVGGRRSHVSAAHTGGRRARTRHPATATPPHAASASASPLSPSYSRSPKNPALQQLQKSSKSASTRVVSVWFGLPNMNGIQPDSLERWSVQVERNMSKGVLVPRNT